MLGKFGGQFFTITARVVEIWKRVKSFFGLNIKELCQNVIGSIRVN